MTGGKWASAARPLRVVFAPDLVGGLWLDADCAAVFEVWRNGELRPVVNRDLLMRYARLWREMGLAESQIRRWSWWFTAPGTAEFVSENPSGTPSANECCTKAGIVSNSLCVVHRGVLQIQETEIPWVSATQFLRSIS